MFLLFVELISEIANFKVNPCEMHNDKVFDRICLNKRAIDSGFVGLRDVIPLNSVYYTLALHCINLLWFILHIIE